jgi:hypothetical protein
MMKLRNSALTIFFASLVGGCVPPSECDWTQIIPYGSEETLRYVVENDRRLAERILSHNSKRVEFCGVN